MFFSILKYVQWSTNLDSFVAANRSSSSLSSKSPSFCGALTLGSLEGALTLDFIPLGFTSGLSLLGLELIHWSWYRQILQIFWHANNWKIKQILCHVMWYQHALSNEKLTWLKQWTNKNDIKIQRQLCINVLWWCFQHVHVVFTDCFVIVLLVFKRKNTSSSLKSELATGFLDGKDVFFTWTDLDFGVDEKRS